MSKGKSPVKGAGLTAAFVLLITVCMGLGVEGVQTPSETTPTPRADIITIDGLKSFGKLERPPVTFLHDRHTEALAKQNKSCAACHLSEKNRQSPKFKRLKDTGKTAIMELYHSECITCHKETPAPSGPVTCGGCHKDGAPAASSWNAFAMDKSLHYRHSKAQDNKCEKCHHDYDPVAKKLFYAKGKERSCRYCHKEVGEENRISMRQAAHLDCVGCHNKRQVANETAGPLNCSGCHDPQEQKIIEVVKEVPRMQLNQPDVVFVKRDMEKTAATPQNTGMLRVPFDHKSHEAYNDSCRVCHHADLTACAKCHTRTGAKEGNHIKLAKAMHQVDSRQSCIGCHGTRQQDTRCAGCHAFIEPGRALDADTCKSCHMGPAPGEATPIPPDAKLDETALQLLEARSAVVGTYPIDDIPEKVKIGNISNQYRAADMPHRKIVTTLLKGVREDQMARYFHRNEGTLCQGCHHRSPATQKPSKCGSCHGRPFDDVNPARPGLMAAYHQQCMGCHQSMDIKKPLATDCEACHLKK